METENATKPEVGVLNESAATTVVFVYRDEEEGDYFSSLLWLPYVFLSSGLIVMVLISFLRYHQKHRSIASTPHRGGKRLVTLSHDGRVVGPKPLATTLMQHGVYADPINDFSRARTPDAGRVKVNERVYKQALDNYRSSVENKQALNDSQTTRQNTELAQFERMSTTEHAQSSDYSSLCEKGATISDKKRDMFKRYHSNDSVGYYNEGYINSPDGSRQQDDVLFADTDERTVSPFVVQPDVKRETESPGRRDSPLVAHTVHEDEEVMTSGLRSSSSMSSQYSCEPETLGLITKSPAHARQVSFNETLDETISQTVDVSSSSTTPDYKRLSSETEELPVTERTEPHALYSALESPEGQHDVIIKPSTQPSYDPKLLVDLPKLKGPLEDGLVSPSQSKHSSQRKRHLEFVKGHSKGQPGGATENEPEPSNTREDNASIDYQETHM